MIDLKSENVKKIVACTTGALMLGAAVVSAVSIDEQGLGNFRLFSGAEPNVKIVIGSSALPEDAVAAANIAAMIGNLAYSQNDVIVLGKDALTCEGGDQNSETFSGSASIDVRTPSGTSSGIAYAMKTYIGGYLDKDVSDDRTDAWSGVGQLMPTQYNTNYAGRRITNYESQLASHVSVVDSTSSKSYFEDEKYYVYAQPSYDSSSKTVKSKQPKLGYEAVFSDPIPVCTNTAPSPATCDAQYFTDTHRVKIKLLGAEWVVYGLYNFNANGIAGSTTQVVLGKELRYNEFMKLGETVDAQNGYSVLLKDISSQPYGGSHVSAVSFEIYDKDKNLVDVATLQETGPAEYNKHGVVVKLWTAFVGTSGTAYAKVSIFSEKMTLTNGQEINVENRPWTVNVVEGGTTFGASLLKIQLLDVAEATTGLEAGQSLYFLKEPKLMSLTYNGLETVASKDNIQLNFLTPQYFPQNSSDSTTKANVVALTSTRSSAFQFGSDSSDRAYYVVGNPVGLSVGDILYNKNGYYVVYNASVNGSLNYLDYNYGPNTIKLSFNSSAIESSAYPDLADYVIHIPEYTTDSDTTPYAYKIDVGNAATNNPSFTPSSSSTSFGYGPETNYPNPIDTASTYENGFISMRGGSATVTQSSASISYPSSLVHALYTFSSADTTTSNGTSYTQTFKSGDTILDTNGYLIKMDALSCKSSSGANATPVSLSGADKISCSQAKAYTVSKLDTASRPLVVLDTQASASEQVILVGGPLVNTLTAQTNPQMQPGESFVKVVGNKIIVAGYTASETQAAANSLIQWLSSKADTLVR